MPRRHAKKNPCGCAAKKPHARKNPDDELPIEPLTVTPGEPAPSTSCLDWVRLERVPSEYAECMARLGTAGKISTAKDVWEVLHDRLEREDQEVGIVLLLDCQLNIRGAAEVSRGERESTTVPIADILRIALVDGATGLVFVHNHPTGSSTPSDDDKTTTVALNEACEAVGLLLVDHCILGMNGEYFSFADAGLLSSDLVMPPDPEPTPWVEPEREEPFVDNPLASDRQRWDALHASYATAIEAARKMQIDQRVKYGDSNWRTWASRGDRNKLEKLEERANKIGDKIVELLVRISPRGEAWLSGGPAWWIREKLTWEDAVRPVGEALSVEVPAPYGAAHGLRENPLVYVVGDMVTLPAGTKVGMGKLRASVQARIDQLQTASDGSTFYGVSWTDAKTGKRRTTWWAPPAENPQVEDRSSGARRGWEHRRERDEWVVQNLDPSLVPLWTRLKDSFRGTPEERYEALMQYVHDHPGEETEALQSGADDWLQAEIQAGRARENPRLTPDVSPYEGVGIQAPEEYKATLAFLRAVGKAEEMHGRDPDPWAIQRFLQSQGVEYRGAMAAIRGGLVQQSGHDRTGPYRLTPYGREYLAQREHAVTGRARENPRGSRAMRYTSDQVTAMLANAVMWREQLTAAARERGYTGSSVAPFTEVLAYLRGAAKNPLRPVDRFGADINEGDRVTATWTWGGSEYSGSGIIQKVNLKSVKVQLTTDAGAHFHPGFVVTTTPDNIQ